MYPAGPRTRRAYCISIPQRRSDHDAMIAEGRIKPGQRIVCVHWSWVTAGPDAHEEALAELETAP